VIYVEAPTPYHDVLPDEARDWPKVFLAGGITGCRDWQGDIARVFAPFKMVVMNPRRETFDVTDPNASEAQITWEFNHLIAADLIMFWFSHETVQPITLFELGSWLHSDKPLVVGVDPRYSRAADVRIQSSLVRGKHLDIHTSLMVTAWAVLRDLGITPADQHLG
jgi:hypothetical protein